MKRQSTLRAVFDWSWDLLSLPEKAAFAQLSVFEGGFTLESVEAILDLSAYENAPWPMDALQSLVQKSLVRQITDDRFDLLVSKASEPERDDRYDEEPCEPLSCCCIPPRQADAHGHEIRQGNDAEQREHEGSEPKGPGAFPTLNGRSG